MSSTAIIRRQARRFMRWFLPRDTYMECIWDGRSWWARPDRNARSEA